MGPDKLSSPYKLQSRRGNRISLAPHPESPDPNDNDAVRMWLTLQPRPWAVDLFSGAGGLSLGLEQAGFSVVASADSDPVSTETHAANIQGLTWKGTWPTHPTSFINWMYGASTVSTSWQVDPHVSRSPGPVLPRLGTW